MRKRDGLTRRQIWSISFLSLLAPALRLLPGWSAALAGSASWLSPLAALPVLLLLNALIAAFLKNRRPGEGLGAMLLRALGKRVGGAALLLYALWMTFYAGFLMRSGAERFITTIYPNSGPGIFVGAMLVMGLIAALGRVRALGRAAEIFRPLLAVTLALVLVFALSDFKPDRLLPVTASDALPVLYGALPTGNTVGFVLVTAAFLDGYAPITKGRGKTFALWTVLSCLFLLALSAATLGRFGAELTARLSYPFFVLVRNTEIFGVVERLEALVTALWVFPDFVLVSAALIIGSGAARLALGWPADMRQAKMLSLENGRFIIWLSAAAALAAALLIAPTSFELEQWSRQYVPLLNMIMNAALITAAFIVGKIRKTI